MRPNPTLWEGLWLLVTERTEALPGLVVPIVWGSMLSSIAAQVFGTFLWFQMAVPKSGRFSRTESAAVYLAPTVGAR